MRMAFRMVGVTGAPNRMGKPVSGRSVVLSLLALAAAGLATAAAAQDAECGRLLASIHALESDSGQRDTSAFDRAAQKQRYEIDRTRRYAAQLDCHGQNGGFFSDGPPPECSDIEDRLARMQDNLEQIESRARDARQPDDNPARRAALVARYNAICAARSGNPTDLSQNGSDLLPEDGSDPAGLNPPDDLSTVPLNGDIMQDGSQPSREAGATICVRTCDGGYFPLAPHATTDQLDGLEKLCQASCPNTEAKLYSMHNGELGSATAIDGSTYSMLPAAFKFEKTYTATCTCKPPGQSWAQALANAEQLLEKDEGHHDVTVTTALSDQMAKPVAPTPTPPKGKAARKAAAQQQAASKTDAKVALEGARGAQAPTASNESSGIGGPDKATHVLGPSDGLKITTQGPDGASKRIRLIVP
jgi:hypothetical protein